MIKTHSRLTFSGKGEFGEILSFLRPRSIGGVELVFEDLYSRTFRWNGSQGYFTVTSEGTLLDVILFSEDEIEEITKRELIKQIGRLFDLDRDFDQINRLLAKDPLLAGGMKDGQVPRLPAAFNVFEFAIRAVLGQQITVKAATTLAGRIAKRAGITCAKSPDSEYPDGLQFFFPNPNELIDLDLSNLGITNTRQNTVKTVTQAILDGRVNLNRDQDFDSFYRNFTQLKGIGDWTANYVAMRGLGMIDSFPASDLGVIKALSGEEKKESVKNILIMAERWRPYRSYAALCLWNTLT